MKHPFPETPEATARDRFRADLRAQCIAGGFTGPTLDETIDLAMHACDEAMDAVTRICGASPNVVVALQALPLAFQLLSQNAAGSAEKMIALTKATGEFGSFEAVIQP